MTTYTTPSVDLTARAYQENRHGSWRRWYPVGAGFSGFQQAFASCRSVGGNHLDATKIWVFTTGWNCNTAFLPNFTSHLFQ